ncbi:MAG: redoxin domain-containing protein [Bacteroidota bacterium]
MKALVKFGLVSLFAILFSCNSNPPKQENEQTNGAVETEESNAFFVADPQPVPEVEVQTLEIGSKAPDFNLPGTDGVFHSLSEYDAAKVLVIIFTCNHCPTAQAYEDRMIAIADAYKEQGVQVVAISPNSPLGLLYEELGYSDLDDDFEAMVVRAEEKGYNFPYLYDGDDHAVSLEYGPIATPHAFVFDSDRLLQYVGRMDDSEKPGTANAEDLRAAIDAVLAGQSVSNPETKTFGCSTKWAWKTEYKVKVEKEWAEKPVSLEDIDEAGIQKLIANDTDKLRLINIWATWCGPCVMEYPSFIEIHRMYQGRDFEFISLSADNPQQKEVALKFLEKKNSAVQNYIFEKDDKYALIEAVDPDWQGALPYTLLIEPGGKKLYAKQGIITPHELKRLIVDHPKIGRYY